MREHFTSRAAISTVTGCWKTAPVNITTSLHTSGPNCDAFSNCVSTWTAG